jgi:geranylgeranyl pyrophosphate synthase
MEKQEYKDFMLKTNREVGKIILEYLEPLKKENIELYKLCSELLKKKIGTLETREYFMRVSYEMCSGKNWNEEIKHACVAVEFELASMYYTNRIFDDKGGNKILSKPNNQVIAAMITRDLASQALTRACKNVNYKTFVKIKNLFDEINKTYYIGQFFEIELNIYNSKTKLNWKELIDLYYKRNYGVNNSFFEKIGTIGAILGEGTKKQIKSLSEFGKNYGMMLQIINDIGDFVPAKYNDGTEEKLPEDAHSDIRHGKLTLPIIYTLTKDKENKEIIIEALNNKKIKRTDLVKVTKILINNGSIDFSKKVAMDFMNEAKKSIQNFPIEKRRFLSSMGVMAWTNRYYKALERFKIK